MAETIESFVTKLRTEGVQQGKQEAEQIKSDAQKEADAILADARAQAEKVIADAGNEAASIMSRSRTELELASRDAVLKLRESLQKALQAVLTDPVEKQLDDDNFLKELIKSILDRFMDADIDSYAPVKINVSPEMNKRLCDWAVNELRYHTQNDAGGFDLNDNLRQAGFEFTLHGATVEITRDSVVETLMHLVGPGLREILSKAAEGK